MTDKSFWLMSSSLVNSEDVKTLTLLYQPLIGVDGLGCYLMMSNLINPVNLQTEVYSIQYLLDLLNFNEEQLKNCLDKLDAIGLLTTFVKDNIYLFRINMPLKARQFFLDSILGPFLKSEIGEKNFNELFSYFSVPEVSKKGYENITKSFDQVYTAKTFDLLKSERFVVGRKNNGGVIIKDAFDFDAFFETLPVRLKKRRLYTKKVVSQIASIMYVYNFTEREIVKILSLAYDDQTNKIFPEKIGILASDLFAKNYGEDQITIQKQPDVEHEIDLASITPQDIVKVFGGKMTNKSASLNIIREFIGRNAVDIGLLNGVILASLKYTEDFPPLTYLEKVLADWLSKGIKNGKDAMIVLKGIEEKPKRTYSRKRQRVADDEPEWLDEIMDSIREDD